MPVEAAAITAMARKRRTIVDHFCAQHAITPYDTIIYKPSDLLAPAFNQMMAERLIRQEGRGYYWLDLRALDAATAQRRQKQVPVSIAVAVLIALVIMLGFYQG